jgi:hypothetical protein
MALKVPQPLKIEHAELHGELVKGLSSGGQTEKMAKAVAKLLHPHFVKEEEFALPPLGLLSTVAGGRITADMRQALAMTEKLKRELPRMLREHKAVLAALKKLSAAAKREKKVQYVRFSEKLAIHAKTEEKVLYPAAILVGELLKVRFLKRG